MAILNNKGSNRMIIMEILAASENGEIHEFVLDSDNENIKSEEDRQWEIDYYVALREL